MQTPTTSDLSGTWQGSTSTGYGFRFTLKDDGTTVSGTVLQWNVVGWSNSYTISEAKSVFLGSSGWQLSADGQTLTPRLTANTLILHRSSPTNASDLTGEWGGRTAPGYSMSLLIKDDGTTVSGTDFQFSDRGWSSRSTFIEPKSTFLNSWRLSADGQTLTSLGAGTPVILHKVSSPTADLSGTFIPKRPEFHKNWYAGGTQTLPLVIHNTGQIAATGTVQIDYYLSTDQTLSKGNDKLLESKSAGIGLAAGASEAFKVMNNSVIIPPDTKLRTYYIIADINPKQSIKEINITNNTVVSSRFKLCSGTALSAVQLFYYDKAIQTVTNSRPAAQTFADAVTLDAAALAEIKKHEGFVPFPYLDDEDRPTIGFGTLISGNNNRAVLLGLGFSDSEVQSLQRDAVINGRAVKFVMQGAVRVYITCSKRGSSPLQPQAISQQNALKLASKYEVKVRELIAADLSGHGTNMAALSGNAWIALIDMGYNLGPNKLFGFNNFFNDIESKSAPDIGCAGYEMFKSKWVTQVRDRAVDDYVLFISSLPTDQI